MKKENEADILERFVAKAAELSRTSAPTRRRMPRITRMTRPEMRNGSRGSVNPVRAIYQNTETARDQTIAREVVNPTREVGPGDEYNNVYSTGKETQERWPKNGRK